MFDHKFFKKEALKYLSKYKKSYETETTILFLRSKLGNDEKYNESLKILIFNFRGHEVLF